MYFQIFFWKGYILILITHDELTIVTDPEAIGPYSSVDWIIALHVRNSRSSRSEVFLGKGVLKICSKFTGKHP